MEEDNGGHTCSIVLSGHWVDEGEEQQINSLLLPIPLGGCPVNVCRVERERGGQVNFCEETTGSRVGRECGADTRVERKPLLTVLNATGVAALRVLLVVGGGGVG